MNHNNRYARKARTYSVVLLELKEALGVVVADVFNHLVNTLLLITGIWYQTILDILADQVTQGAAEVLMTWV